MVKSQSYRSRLAHAVWRLGGNAGILVALLVTFFIGYLAKGFLGTEESVPGEGGPKQGVAEKARTEIWTCSMHPAVQQPKPGKCPICGMNLIPRATDAGDEMAGMRQFTTSEAAKELMNIQTSPVERKFVTAEIRMVGKVDFDETKLGYITAWVPGRIDRLYVDYTGVEVRKGDHMVYLYSPDLLTGQDELLRAAEAVRNMKANAPAVLIDTAQATLEAAREKLRLWGLTDAQIKKAEKEGITSDHITIYAPMAGTVIHRAGQEGMYVDTGTRFYTIADLSSVWVKLDAYESDLAWLHYGQQVSFYTEAYPGEVFEGRIIFIDPILNPRTRTVKVRVNVSNSDGRLKPEMFVRSVVRVQMATGGRIVDPGLAGKWIGPMHPEIIKDGPGTCDICGMQLVKAEDLGHVPPTTNDADMPLVIPASAPLVTGKRAIVYVELPDRERPTYEGREIVLGARAGDYYIVRTGLREGERVVTNGNFKIDSALQIMAKPSMMTPDGGGGGGHDHGGGPKKKADSAAVPAEALSFASKEQFSKLDRAYETLSEAMNTGGEQQIQSALAAFDTALGAVDMSLLSGHSHMVWMEYSMRLVNGVTEARDATSPEALERIWERMRTAMAQLRGNLGLTVDHAGHASEPELAGPPAFQAQLGTVLDASLGISAALAGDDSGAAAKAVQATMAALEAVDMSLLAGDAHMAWMKHLDALQKALGSMQRTKDLDGLRSGLAPVVEALIAAIARFGVAPGAPVYQAHCPMALDGEGANWLQTETDVRNPYYGSAMISCGEIVGTVRRAAGTSEAPIASGEGAQGKEPSETAPHEGSQSKGDNHE